MPLPYPGVFKSRKCKSEADPVHNPEFEPNDRAFQLGVNLVVLVLNWLHLRRPGTAPQSIVLGQRLNRLQWRVVRQMEGLMEACKVTSPISANDMGRTAGKIEQLEDALSRLSVFEDAALQNLGSAYERKSVSKSYQRFAPGLKRCTAGEVLGALSGKQQFVAKPIDSSRLEFRGEPCFNPSRFLDPQGREVFEHPIQCSMAPEDDVETPPHVVIHCDFKEKMRLFRKLDSCGRLGMVSEDEVVPGYQAGLFCVPKDFEHDRLIFDSRPFNQLETGLGRWVRAMASISPLLDLQLSDNEVCRVSGTDLRDFYYSFEISHERMVRNSLVGPLSPQLFRDFRCYRKELSTRKYCYLCLRTLAMGDTQAVELAQTAHLGMLVQAGLVDEFNLITMDSSIPREHFFCGIVIDDLVLFEIMLRRSVETTELEHPSIGSQVLDEALQEYRDVGLLPHPKKTFRDELYAEFWGCQFDGEAGTIQASLKRMIPIIAVTQRVLAMGVCSVGLLEVIVGCWTSVFLFRRRLLCLFNVVYSAFNEESERSHVLRLSLELKEELLLMLALCPLAVTRLRLQNSRLLYCSDASEWGIGVTAAQLPPRMQSEIHRHKLRKAVWSKLLSPLKALKAEELPEGGLPSHPLWMELASSLQFDEVCKQRCREGVHINILELRGMLRAESEASQQCFPLRYFSLADSQVALGVWTKGRSSSVGLNMELQQSLGIHLGCGMFGNAGYVPTELNSADDPTRGAPVRGPAKPLDASLVRFEDGDDAAFDKWLDSYDAGPYQCSGLPPLSELRTGAIEAPRKSMRVMRRKEFRSRKASAALSETTCPKTEASPSPVKDSPPLPSCSMPVRGGTRASTAKCGRGELPKGSTVAEPVGRSKLSLAAREVLKKVPISQFQVPRSWKPLPSDWLPEYPGFLDLYSGKKGVARELCEQGDVWTITFELDDGPNQDVLAPDNKELIESLLRSGCILGLGIAIFCSSFSRAVRPPVRSSQLPYGLPGLTPKMQAKVLLGNAHAIWVAFLVTLCVQLGIGYWVENPDGSFLWLLPEFLRLGSNVASKLWRLDYCTMGTPWRKRTRFMTSCHLAGQTFWCSRRHSHVPLKGWCRAKRCSWTRLAQTYPRRLCQLLARAFLRDCGVLKTLRPIQMSAISRCEHCRVGEAKNPGPRQRQGLDRNLQRFEQFSLVTPGTLKLGAKVWDAFQHWLRKEFSPAAARELQLHGELLGMLVSEFGKYLYSSGQSIYLLRQLVTHIQRVDPGKRLHMYGAWQVIAKWEGLEPTVHRTPLPYVVYRALVALALAFGWKRVAGIIVLTFEMICRPGEVLRASREDLLLPMDLVAEDPGRCFLRIRNPKSRRRGLGSTQHSKTSDPLAAAFLQSVFGHLSKSSLLFEGSPSTFRKRWDYLIQHLQIPSSVGLTPASMRAGGAVRCYRCDEDIAKLMWKMRIKSQETLQHYLQEVGAESAFLQLPSCSKQAVVASSSLFEVSLRRHSLDGS
eukprot:Skav228367  [mRNA]  locus=scaffold1981:191093:195553:+ [translate_table: standard]